MAAFYKNENNVLIEAPNFVRGPDFELLKENKDDYAYPCHDWHWFDTRQEALNHFGLEEEDII